MRDVLSSRVPTAREIATSAASLSFAGLLALSAGCGRQPVAPSGELFTPKRAVEQVVSTPTPAAKGRARFDFPPNAPSAIIDQNTWVEVQNLDPVSNINVTYNFGESCSITPGERMVKIGEEPATSKYLARYVASHDKAGAQCPDGVLFFVGASQFAESTGNYQEKMRRKQLEEQVVADLLSKESSTHQPEKPNTAVVPAWEWVEIRNPDYKSSYYSGFEPTCGIVAGDTVQVIGEDSINDRLLVRYTAKGNTDGTPCETGTIFFTPKDKFETMTSRYQQEKIQRQQEQDRVRRVLSQPK